VDVSKEFKDLGYLKKMAPKVDCWLPPEKINSSRASMKN
jgi:hypothetical protein